MDKAAHIKRNLKFAIVGELLLAALKFLSRRAFVILLGREYVGLNGLFADILSVLSLAELGFSVSITYSFYHPVAEGNTEMIKSLVRLYRRVYQAVGLVVFALGLSLTPFLSFFVKEMGSVHIQSQGHFLAHVNVLAAVNNCFEIGLA